MASDDWPDWLPADWTVQINKVEQRKVKCYVDSQGHKCYSKPQVFEYLRKMGRSIPNENNDNGDGSTVDLSVGVNVPNTNEMPESLPGGQLTKLTPRSSRRKSKPIGDSSSGDGSPPEPLSSERHHGDSSWLPDGWTVEVKTRQTGSSSGMKFKCYTDPISGQKFFSKPQVLNHLAKTNRSSVGQKEVGTGLISPTPISTWETDGTLAGDGSLSEPLSSQRKDGDSSWLPEGWTVEVKARKGGTSGGMKYKLYTDPVSGQKFFSKPQVLNHLAKINGSAGGGQKEGFTEPIIASPISSWRDNSTTELDKSQTIEATKFKKNNSEKKTESARLSSDNEVVSRTPVEGLPPGWIKEMRLRKRGVVRKTDPYYLDPLSEYVFFSKKDALRYLESGNVRSCVIKPLKRDMSKDCNVDMTLTGGEMDSPSDPSKETETSKELPNDPVTELNTNGSVTELTTNGSVTELNSNGSGIENPKPIRSITGGVFSTPNTSRKEVRSISGGTFSSPKEEFSEWLPDGWVVEGHYKASGQKYKIFKETATGKKLYSKPQVMNYLNGSSSNSRKRKENNSGGPDSSQNLTPADGSRPKRSIKKKGNSEKNSDYEEVITTCSADGLPPGWIKELRTKIYATHKRNDPFYTDPVSGYIFRSKLDALRFLDTGDVNLCAIRPKVKDKDGNEVYVYTNAVQKPADTTNEKQLFEGGENSVEKQHNDVSIDEDPKSADITPTRVTRVSNRITKRNDSPTTLPAESSKRQKGVNPGTEENVAVKEKQGSGVNLEKQPDDDGNLSYDIPEDDNWTDQCIDFAVKTLTNEILFIGQPTSSVETAFPEEGAAANAGVDPTGVNETPTKVN